MYAERIQLVNYGPIDHIDMAFPFDGNRPKPAVFVGKNGSGKSNLLSHIVNGLVAAHDAVFPYSRTIQADQIYKLRSNAYIAVNRDYYFGKVDYSDGISVTEIRTLQRKQEGSSIPATMMEPDAQIAWGQIPLGGNDHFVGPVKRAEDERKIRDVLSTNCVLYFPPNRFEEPAWLNIDKLNARAEYMDLQHRTGHSDRHVIVLSPLQGIQRWLFEVVFDHRVFEINTTHLPIPPEFRRDDVTYPIVLFDGYQGQSTALYEMALDVVRRIIGQTAPVRLGIGPRQNRAISVMSGDQTIIPNIFQLSSGETSLLNLFLAILRDVDLSDASLTSLDSAKGIVVVDEIELHLHVNLQYDLLPQLIKLFPNVQFIVTTQSPLFVLGMEREFGIDGFGLYHLPRGDQISPEEFGEFGAAYQVFAETSAFYDDVRTAVKESQRPLVFVDGVTDVKYIQKAAELLGKSPMIENVEFRPAGGDGQLTKIWNSARALAADLIPEKVIVLHDCDSNGTNAEEGDVFRRVVPKQSKNPIQKGVENLFSESTLTEAMHHKPAFIDVTPEHPSTLRGESITIPEQWVVNADEKSNMCDWLCTNGVAEDFGNFHVIFDILGEILD